MRSLRVKMAGPETVDHVVSALWGHSMPSDWHPSDSALSARPLIPSVTPTSLTPIRSEDCSCDSGA